MSTLYLKEVVLENVRCFEHFKFSFEKKGSSILLLGDNGDGKSTFLRALAMGLCDRSSASALFRELPGTYVRKGSKKPAIITITLAGGGGYSYKIITTIENVGAFETVGQRLVQYRGKKITKRDMEPNRFPWDDIFLTAYGAGIRIKGSADFHDWLTADAIYPLFKYDAPLQNSELAVRRIRDEAERLQQRYKEKDLTNKESALIDASLGLRTKIKNGRFAPEILGAVKAILRNLLDLSKGDTIEITRSGIMVGAASRWVGEAEVSELGDGYRSIVTISLDILAWWFVYCDDWIGQYDITNVFGIVIIDEIEQHLHPRYQRIIIELLDRTFPNVQFIVSTHSPLCAAGTADVKRKSWGRVRLSSEGGLTRAIEIPSLDGVSMDEILESDAFGLTDARNPGSEKIRRRFIELMQILEPTTEQLSEIEELRAVIAKKIPRSGLLPKYRNAKASRERREFLKRIDAKM